MKANLWLLPLCIYASTAIGDFLPDPRDGNGIFHLNSGESPYVGYAPPTYQESQPISLLVWLHGCGGYAEDDLWSVAPAPTRESQSYIAISIGGRDGVCWASGDTPKVIAAIRDVARYFNINRLRIFLSGYSSGGDLAYRVGFRNASLFAGLLVENSDPFTGSGMTAATATASASWKINIIHLAHTSDSTYHIATTRANLNALSANGFPVTMIERAGHHYDAPSAETPGTVYDLIQYLLPYMDSALEIPSINVSVTSADPQNMTVSISEPVGALCTLLASEDFAAPNWIPVATNRVPFIFQEPILANSSRFFRAVLAP